MAPPGTGRLSFESHVFGGTVVVCGAACHRDGEVRVFVNSFIDVLSGDQSFFLEVMKVFHWTFTSMKRQLGKGRHIKLKSSLGI